MRQGVWKDGIVSAVGALVFMSAFQTANAAPVSRLNGQAVYDTDLDKTGTRYAWAVSRGDISPAAVPVPAAAWLFGSGLLGLFGVARRIARET
jgi:hypothetical protein